MDAVTRVYRLHCHTAHTRHVRRYPSDLNLKYISFPYSSDSLYDGVWLVMHSIEIRIEFARVKTFDSNCIRNEKRSTRLGMSCCAREI